MQYTWSDIKQHIASCTHCPLSLSRQRPVMGRGDYKADIMLIAEAPGRSAGDSICWALRGNIGQSLERLRTVQG